jgi:hypothetical protein
MPRFSRETEAARLIVVIESPATSSSEARWKFTLRLCNRRAKSVKTLLRGFGLAFLVGAVLVLGGCAPDNESEAQRNQAKLGAPPPSDVKGTDDFVPLTNQDQLAERRKQMQQVDPAKAQRSGQGATRGR